MKTHLFVAPSTQSFGEVVLGLRLANELRLRGDRVVFLAPAESEVLFRQHDIAFEPIDAVLPALHRGLVDAIARHACESVVLVDLMVMVLALVSRRLDPAILDALPAPTFAIDIWDLRRVALRLDLGAGEIVLPPSVRHIVPRRLVPVPFARLDARGAYCALPSTTAPTERGRRTDERVVVFSTSRFQSHASTAAQKRVLAAVPRHIVELCLRADPRVRVVHVGPEPIEGMDRYQFRAQMSGSEYERLLADSDLVVTMNQSATSLTTALAFGVPALVAISDVPRDTSRIVPFPFRVFPFGFVELLGSLLEDNPFAGAVASAEIVPGGAFVDAARSLLFDEDVRAASLARIRNYVDRVRQLPSGLDRFDAESRVTTS